jgi:succinate dehydrogenase/fumarate reductase-like Fe-S protein
MSIQSDNERASVPRIRRQDRPDAAPRWEEFAVPRRPNVTIIACLQYIAAPPWTTAGQQTTPEVYDSCCLEDVCGACTMPINGRGRQACSARVDRRGEPGSGAGKAGEPITLEPMSKFPVVRDLFVDRQRLFDDLKDERLDVMMGAGGIADCSKAGHCVAAFPKNIDNLVSIATVGRQSTTYAIRQFFSK